MPNLAALRAAIFLLSAKNRWGGHICAPPGRARVNEHLNEPCLVMHVENSIFEFNIQKSFISSYIAF